ncbi:uncharacterized protein LOC133667904 [Populus nigra]|uniref:uncharacterized protein LOC133667904 n=1 Tax=Populus nigra TaxID=3691 RepID=UPI002B2722B2|nr:uncharacterized protein LOC133667904 [Populus nigra]
MHIGYQFTKFCVIMSHISSYTSGIVFLLSKISFMYLKPQLLQITFHGGLQPFCSVWKDFESRCYVVDRVLLGMSNITHHQRISFKTQAIKSFYSNFIESFAFINDHSCPNELGNINCNFYKDWDSSIGAIDELHPHPMGGGKLKFLESYNISGVEEGPLNSADQFADNTDSLIRLMKPEITSTIDMTPENPSLGSDSLEMDNDSLSSAKAGFDDFLGEVRDSINTSVNNGGNVVQSSLDTITSSITSIKEGASEAVDGALSKVFSTFDQTEELAAKD